MEVALYTQNPKFRVIRVFRGLKIHKPFDQEILLILKNSVNSVQKIPSINSLENVSLNSHSAQTLIIASDGFSTAAFAFWHFF